MSCEHRNDNKIIQLKTGDYIYGKREEDEVVSVVILLGMMLCIATLCMHDVAHCYS